MRFWKLFRRKKLAASASSRAQPVPNPKAIAKGGQEVKANERNRGLLGIINRLNAERGLKLATALESGEAGPLLGFGQLSGEEKLVAVQQKERVQLAFLGAGLEARGDAFRFRREPGGKVSIVLVDLGKIEHRDIHLHKH